MDADLQHDPAHIPDIAAPIISGKADFVIGSRHVGGGEVSDDWPLHRRIISWGATSLAKPLTSASDPMSGFFAIHRDTFARGLLRSSARQQIRKNEREGEGMKDDLTNDLSCSQGFEPHGIQDRTRTRRALWLQEDPGGPHRLSRSRESKTTTKAKAKRRSQLADSHS